MQLSFLRGHSVNSSRVDRYAVMVNWRDWSESRRRSFSRRFEALRLDVQKAYRAAKQVKGSKLPSATLYLLGVQDKNNALIFHVDDARKIALILQPEGLYTDRKPVEQPSTRTFFAETLPESVSPVCTPLAPPHSPPSAITNLSQAISPRASIFIGNEDLPAEVKQPSVMHGGNPTHLSDHSENQYPIPKPTEVAIRSGHATSQIPPISSVVALTERGSGSPIVKSQPTKSRFKTILQGIMSKIGL